MNQGLIKKISKITVVLALCILGGCSTSFTYNNLPWLSSFWIDDYIDLDKQQSKEIKHIIKTTRDWHRDVELPKYKQDILTLKAKFNSPLDKNELAEQITVAKKHWVRLLNYISDPLILLAESLTAQQQQMLVYNIRAEIKEEQEQYSELTAQDHSDERLEQQLDYFEDWLGKLTSKQRGLISAANDQHQSTFTHWLTYKRDRLKALESLFNSQSDERAFKSQLKHILIQREAFMSDELLKRDQINLMQYVNLLINLNSTLSNEQKNNVNAKFDELIETVDDLMDD